MTTANTTMTVAQLIKHLMALPSDAAVLVEGYERGLDAVDSVRIVEVTRCQAPHDWDGEFRERGAGEGGVTGVLLVGRRGHRR